MGSENPTGAAALSEDVKLKLEGVKEELVKLRGDMLVLIDEQSNFTIEQIKGYIKGYENLLEKTIIPQIEGIMKESESAAVRAEATKKSAQKNL